MKIVQIIVLILVSVFIGTAVGSYVSTSKSQRRTSIDYANAMLYDLNIEMDVLEHWHSKYKNDQVLEKRIKHLILNNMMAISILKPDIDSLQGTPLDALYRLSKFNRENGVLLQEYKPAFEKPLNYLSSIEKDIESTIEKRKSIQKKIFK